MKLLLLVLDEINQMKYQYTELQGAYREEERTMLEFYFLGRAVMQFKKYLPMMLHNAFHSKTTLRAKGRYKIMKDGKGNDMFRTDSQGNQKPIYEWNEDIIEGRWIVAAKLIYNTSFAAAGWSHNPEYKWSQLSPSAKVDMIEGIFTLLILAGSTLALANLGDDDEAKKTAKFLQVLVNNTTQQWNFTEMLKNTTYFALPASAGKLFKTYQSLMEFGVAAMAYTEVMSFVHPEMSMEDAYTRDGHFRGMSGMLKLPFVSIVNQMALNFESFGIFTENGHVPYRETALSLGRK